MEILNIGLPELLLILVIMLVVLGPDQTLQQMKKLAGLVRRMVRSPLWADILNTSREIKDLPNKMLRDTGLDEELNDLNRSIRNPIDESIKNQKPQSEQASQPPPKSIPVENQKPTDQDP